ncbi:hypothetical protein [Aeromicrobium sp. IC_218]|uniref:DUF7144 family membrane protein n=1 Tax=Aeromicrobium sp. IC_218 TaxID=2545468 RepID=UPI001039FFB7|nr:hypothetical protein [Aeromicrobium sp. IC_218]TCI97646.1 hypothetical protein E0W78_11395 [Aeromicrobium sp. IC_218]
MNGRHESGATAGPDRPAPAVARARVMSQVAAVVLLVTALLSIVQGVAALADDELLTGGDDYAYAFDLTAWGWVHLVIGLLSVAVAAGILTGQSWGFVTGLVVAGASMLANFAFLPVYPLWTSIVIAFDVLVVRALCTLLRDVEAPGSGGHAA